MQNLMKGVKVAAIGGVIVFASVGIGTAAAADVPAPEAELEAKWRRLLLRSPRRRGQAALEKSAEERLWLLRGHDPGEWVRSDRRQKQRRRSRRSSYPCRQDCQAPEPSPPGPWPARNWAVRSEFRIR
jgi:hypothetical protein